MRVVIVGCGYLGIALGRLLAPEHDVVGVRRSTGGCREIEAAGFTAVQADATAPSTLSAVPSADAVVFAASAGSRDPEAARQTYVEGQRAVVDALCDRDDPPERYVYTSSTGVYGDRGGDWVDETTPLDPSTARERALSTAESVALDRAREVGVDATVARLGGLYGPERHRLERYLEGPVTAGYLNLIHRRDAAGAVAHLLTETAAGAVDLVNVVDDEPVDKWELADWLADACGEPDPPKQTAGATDRTRRATSKRCSNDRMRSLGYDLTVPTFREGYRPAVEAYLAAAGVADSNPSPSGDE
jgi:nucleoside-diphosphate-sugar epimerase